MALLVLFAAAVMFWFCGLSFTVAWVLHCHRVWTSDSSKHAVWMSLLLMVAVVMALLAGAALLHPGAL